MKNIISEYAPGNKVRYINDVFTIGAVDEDDRLVLLDVYGAQPLAVEKEKVFAIKITSEFKAFNGPIDNFGKVKNIEGVDYYTYILVNGNIELKSLSPLIYLHELQNLYLQETGEMLRISTENWKFTEG